MIIVQRKKGGLAVPLTISNLWAWWSSGVGDGTADNGSPTSGPFADLATDTWTVTQIDDMSGNGRHADTGNGFNLEQSYLNGLPVFGCDITDATYLNYTSGGPAQPFSVYVLIRSTQPSQHRHFLSGSGTSNLSIQRGPSSDVRFLPSGTVSDAKTFTSSAWHKIAMMIDNTDTDRVRIDGTLGDFDAGPGAQTLASQVQIGRYSGGTHNWEGQLAEVLIYSKLLNTTEQASLDTWVSDTYGV